MIRFLLVELRFEDLYKGFNIIIVIRAFESFRMSLNLFFSVSVTVRTEKRTMKLKRSHCDVFIYHTSIYPYYL